MSCSRVFCVILIFISPTSRQLRSCEGHGGGKPLCWEDGCNPHPFEVSSSVVQLVEVHHQDTESDRTGQELRGRERLVAHPGPHGHEVLPLDLGGRTSCRSVHAVRVPPRHDGMPAICALCIAFLNPLFPFMQRLLGENAIEGAANAPSLVTPNAEIRPLPRRPDWMGFTADPWKIYAKCYNKVPWDQRTRLDDPDEQRGWDAWGGKRVRSGASTTNQSPNALYSMLLTPATHFTSHATQFTRRTTKATPRSGPGGRLTLPGSMQSVCQGECAHYTHHTARSCGDKTSTTRTTTCSSTCRLKSGWRAVAIVVSRTATAPPRPACMCNLFVVYLNPVPPFTQRWLEVDPCERWRSHPFCIHEFQLSGITLVRRRPPVQTSRQRCARLSFVIYP